MKDPCNKGDRQTTCTKTKDKTGFKHLGKHKVPRDMSEGAWPM